MYSSLCDKEAKCLIELADEDSLLIQFYLWEYLIVGPFFRTLLNCRHERDKQLQED